MFHLFSWFPSLILFSSLFASLFVPNMFLFVLSFLPFFFHFLLYAPLFLLNLDSFYYPSLSLHSSFPFYLPASDIILSFIHSFICYFCAFYPPIILSFCLSYFDLSASLSSPLFYSLPSCLSSLLLLFASLFLFLFLLLFLPCSCVLGTFSIWSMFINQCTFPFRSSIFH